MVAISLCKVISPFLLFYHLLQAFDRTFSYGYKFKYAGVNHVMLTKLGVVLPLAVQGNKGLTSVYALAAAVLLYPLLSKGIVPI